MSAPKYSSNSYDAASKKYQQLADKYTGANAYNNTNIAAKQAQKNTRGYAENEGAAAQSLSLDAGYSRSRAAKDGAAARASSYQNQYANSYSNALNNIQQSNQNALNAQGTLLSGAQQKDANKYQSDSNRYGAAMGAVGGLFTGASNALSDITKKDIHEETDSETRRAELLARLRG